jgi:hypothetical protein
MVKKSYLGILHKALLSNPHAISGISSRTRNRRKILPQSSNSLQAHTSPILSSLFSHPSSFRNPQKTRFQTTSTMASRPRTVEEWLFALKHRYSYHGHITDPSDPYNKAVSSYRAFIKSVIDSLERNDPEVVSLLSEGFLEYFFDESDPLPDARHLQYLLKDAMLKHPLRRCPGQQVTLALIRAQDCADYLTVKAKVLAAINEYLEWKGFVYDPESLIKDPSSTYFFRNKNGNKDVGSSDTKGVESCLICTDDFDDELHLAQCAPCGHIICRACFGNWLLECDGKFTCPLCRACVVCGANDCEHHDIRQEVVPPIPLPDVLDNLMSEARGQVLHGIVPIAYLELREASRGDRVLLAFIQELMETERGPVLTRLRKDRDEVWDRLEAHVREWSGDVQLTLFM